MGRAAQSDRRCSRPLRGFRRQHSRRRVRPENRRDPHSRTRRTRQLCWPISIEVKERAKLAKSCWRRATKSCRIAKWSSWIATPHLPVPIDDLRIKPDYPALIAALEKCEFKSLLQEVRDEAGAGAEPRVQAELASCRASRPRQRRSCTQLGGLRSRRTLSYARPNPHFLTHFFRKNFERLPPPLSN